MSELTKFRQFLKPIQEIEAITIQEAWFYSRVSSKNQYENNDSIKNQNDVSNLYAKKHDLSITKVLGGTYESAKGDFTRKEFMKLINEVKRSRKRPKYILIFIMSRFSRTGGNAIALANMLVEDLGVHLIETSSGLNTETDIGKMSIYKKLIAAREETMSRMDSILPGMKTALRNGKWLGQAPLGYTKFGPYVKDEARFAARTRIEINKDGEALKEAWKWKRRGERDIHIIEKLKKRGVDMTLKHIHKMWQKPFYAGIIIHNLIDKPVKGDWQAMVSEKDFLYINNKLKENKREIKGYQKETINDPRPLNGDVLCSECGFKLVGYVKKKKIISTGAVRLTHYYKCFKCGGVHINANTTKNALSKGLHEQFKEFLGSFSFDKKLEKPLAMSLVKMIVSRDEEMKKEAKFTKKKISELRKEIETVEERFAIGKIPEKIYEKFSKKYAEDIFRLEQNLPNTIVSTSTLNKKINKVINTIQNLDEIWDSGSYEMKKAIQKIVFPNGMVVQSDNRQLRPSGYNYLLYAITSIKGSYKGNKKGTTQLILDKSLIAENEGFEPPEV